MEKLYWKMYQDRNSVNGTSVIIKEEQIKDEINAAREYDALLPVFEPVFMTEEEFNNLPEFKGF